MTWEDICKVLVVVMMALLMNNLSVVQSKVATVEQVYPPEVEYRCHCPAIEFMCIFPEGALVANWFVSTASGEQYNCDDYDNHHVETGNGRLSLKMNSTTSQSLEGNEYSCTAVYSDSTTAESGTVTLPTIEDEFAKFIDLTAPYSTARSLNITWNHPYKLCKSFTVIVDGKRVTNLGTGTTNYHIDGLQQNTTYYVTVVAKEPGMSDVSVSNYFTTNGMPVVSVINNFTTDGTPVVPVKSNYTTVTNNNHFCYTSHGIFICFALPSGTLCLCCSLSAGLSALACCQKAKAKKAEKNEVGPNTEKVVGHDGSDGTANSSAEVV